MIAFMGITASSWLGTLLVDLGNYLPLDRVLRGDTIRTSGSQTEVRDGKLFGNLRKVPGLRQARNKRTLDGA